MIAWAVMAVRLVLEQPNALGLVTGPIIILLGAIAAFGVALLLIEWAFHRRDKGSSVDEAQVEEVAIPELPAAAESNLSRPCRAGGWSGYHGVFHMVGV